MMTDSLLPLNAAQLNLKIFLDEKVAQYNRPEFIRQDPIVIPHLFSVQQDIEIMGFFASILAWGQRKTIINKCIELIERMDGAPYDFILNHQDSDLQNLLDFKHRTFNDTDLLYFVNFLNHHYNEHESLETAFLPNIDIEQPFRPEFLQSGSGASAEAFSSPVCSNSLLRQREFSIEGALNHFRGYFFSLPDYPQRTKKHVSAPLQKSTCKRLNMFLRWMVRDDENGVDFGIWKSIKPAQLICPCDVHVERVARKLNLISRKQTDWQTALELTENLRRFDPEDPVKYDFALFGLGIEENYA